MILHSVVVHDQECLHRQDFIAHITKIVSEIKLFTDTSMDLGDTSRDCCAVPNAV